MSERPVKILLEDILDAIQAALNFVSVDSYEIFASDRMRVDAVIRNIEII
jgi:uncharacterized protein with HEPN domain